MRKTLNYKGIKWIEYKEPILRFRSFDFAFIFGIIIGSLYHLGGWFYLINFFLILIIYFFVSWMYEKEFKEVSQDD